MKAGSVHTLIMSGVNPVYTLAVQLLLLKGLKVTTSVSLTEDETALIRSLRQFLIIWKQGFKSY
jgi:molybdopterin-containing oxidoreductase family iron-sulfur binding subunit